MNRWRQTAVVALDVPQASGVACLGGDRFLVVDDDRGIYLASSTGEATLLASRKKHPMLRDLEGICLGPGGDVWVVSEHTSEVLALALERGHDGVRLGRVCGALMDRALHRSEHAASEPVAGRLGLGMLADF